MPPIVTILIGLPGSGKSTFLEQTYGADWDGVYDDFHGGAKQDSEAFVASRYYELLRDRLRGGHDCIISDIAYCLEHRLSAAQAGIAALAVEIGLPVNVRLLYFANDPDACRHNVVHRLLHKPRKSYLIELKNIDEYSVQYHPPADAMPVHSCCGGKPETPPDR